LGGRKLDNPTDTNKTENEPKEFEEAEFYDDLPPANPPRLNSFGSLLTSILLNEINKTLQDVNKALAALEAIERGAPPRRNAEGEEVQGNLAEGVMVRLKQSGLEETLREQIARLQASPFKANLEATLRQYWQTLRERSQRLKALLERQRPSGFQPEQYHSEEPAPVANPNWPQPPAASPAPAIIEEPEVPARELLVDIFDEPANDEIVLVAEHPGLLVNTIRVALEHDILTLMANDINGNYYSKECLLPAPVEPNALAQKYHNGVLEIRLKKAPA
jgi:HSP20 family molecular chaperone IbpA